MMHLGHASPIDAGLAIFLRLLFLPSEVFLQQVNVKRTLKPLVSQENYCRLLKRFFREIPPTFYEEILDLESSTPIGQALSSRPCEEL